jgi:ketosteroid isomerase-like protein
MLPRDPEDWPSVFAQHLNAGDLDKVMSLYEPDARFVAPSGETLIGSDRIRQVIAGLIQANTKFRSRVLRATRIDDLALLYTDFDGTTVDGSGKTIELCSRAIEVLRRQPDGTGKLIIGDPNGRGVDVG